MVMQNAQTFSLQSAQYARYRPSYPETLFAYLSGLAQRHERAWDCATGNGQAAVGCAHYFERVTATDISAEQIRFASAHPRIEYAVCAAEAPPLTSHAFDLVVVAQAVHWFHLDLFYAESLRLLRPGGVLAVVGYGFLEITPTIDALVAEQLLSVLDPFWAEGNRLVMDAYRSLPFPIAEIPNVPALAIQVKWNLEQLMAYLRTWSAVKRYVAALGKDPLAPLAEALLAVWGAPERARLVQMPLALKVGRLPALPSPSSR